MFVQEIHGMCRDKQALQTAIDTWMRDLAPGADGWLGTTYGVADDGTCVCVVRFESQEHAQRNSARPEQGQWWAETSRLFEGPVEFHDCPTVMEMGAGGSDDAGFVQIIEGHINDVVRLRSMSEQNADTLRTMRPDVLGGTIAIEENGDFCQTIYFSSEAAAREGEKKEMSAQDQAMWAEMAQLMENLRYVDLREPHFASAK